MHIDIYKVSVLVYIYTWHTSSGIEPTELYRPDNTNFEMPTYIYSYSENLSIPARMEDHSPEEAVARRKPTQGAKPGTDSGHACLWVRLVTPNRLQPADEPYGHTNTVGCTIEINYYDL